MRAALLLVVCGCEVNLLGQDAAVDGACGAGEVRWPMTIYEGLELDTVLAGVRGCFIDQPAT